jgi:hypothetical protein
MHNARIRKIEGTDVVVRQMNLAGANRRGTIFDKTSARESISQRLPVIVNSAPQNVE